jgi:replication fork protection complex subunit Tof1/Swi1
MATARKRKADEPAQKKSKRRKSPPRRKAGPFDESDESEDDNAVGAAEGADSSRAQSVEATVMIDDESENEATDTPLSSQHAPPSKESASGPSKDVAMKDVDEDDDDEDDVPVARRATGRRMRAGFVIDSDSE